MSESIVKLIDAVKRGDASAFLRLVKRIEEICRTSMISRREAWLGKDLVPVTTVHTCL